MNQKITNNKKKIKTKKQVSIDNMLTQEKQDLMMS